MLISAVEFASNRIVEIKDRLEPLGGFIRDVVSATENLSCGLAFVRDAQDLVNLKTDFGVRSGQMRSASHILELHMFNGREQLIRNICAPYDVCVIKKSDTRMHIYGGAGSLWEIKDRARRLNPTAKSFDDSTLLKLDF